VNDTDTPQDAPHMAAEPASVARAVINQRRAAVLAAVLMAGGFWVAGPMGEWQSGVLFAAGVFLGLVNHVMTEFAIQKAIAAEDPVTRNAYARSSLIRLAIISLAAFALTVIFFDGGGIFVLFGLALFHLIALALTAIPLLKEVRNS
jgi:peptidoglycan/LPS O-acetylase OafA/YrhL